MSYSFDGEVGPGDCPSPERIAAAVLRGETLAHIQGCRACSRLLDEFQGLERALASYQSDVFEADRPSPAASAGPSGLRLLAAAAALVLAVMIGIAGILEEIPSGYQEWRGGLRRLEVEVTRDAGVVSLEWNPVPGAATYVVSLRSELGEELHRTEVAAGCRCEWAVTLAPEVRPAALLWTIDALAPDSLRLAAGAGQLARSGDR